MDKNISAFPRPFGADTVMERGGMTLRDWFAGQAISEVIDKVYKCVELKAVDLSSDEEVAENAARLAYIFADAMLKERQK